MHALTVRKINYEWLYHPSMNHWPASRFGGKKTSNFDEAVLTPVWATIYSALYNVRPTVKIEMITLAPTGERKRPHEMMRVEIAHTSVCTRKFRHGKKYSMCKILYEKWLQIQISLPHLGIDNLNELGMVCLCVGFIKN